MGRTSRYSRHRRISMSSSNRSMSSSLMWLLRAFLQWTAVPFSIRGGDLVGVRGHRTGIQGPVQIGVVSVHGQAFEGQAVDRGRPEARDGGPVACGPVAAVLVETVLGIAPVIPVHGPVPGYLGHHRS